MELKKEEMKTIVGGGTLHIVAGIAAALVYIIGTLSGYTNPTRCNN